MSHYVAYMRDRAKRFEVDAEDYLSALRLAAALFNTKREHDIRLIECSDLKHSTEDLIADTEQE